MNKKALLALHISVILFGASALFVKLIDASTLLITLGRCLFSSIALFIFILIKKYNLYLHENKDYLLNIAAGILLAIHWYFFILSVQVSSVHIGTICFTTYPMFVFIIEPIIFKEKYQMKYLISMIMIIVGIFFLIPSFELTNQMTLGIIYGLISGLTFALVSLLNRKLVVYNHSVVTTMYEQVIATITLMIVFIFTQSLQIQISMIDIVELVIYGIVFTGLAHSLYVYGLTYVKASYASVVSMLEPIYSIILAIFILNESISFNEIIASILILSAVFISSLSKKK